MSYYLALAGVLGLVIGFPIGHFTAPDQRGPFMDACSNVCGFAAVNSVNVKDGICTCGSATYTFKFDPREGIRNFTPRTETEL